MLTLPKIDFVKTAREDDLEDSYRGKELAALRGALEYAQSLGSASEMESAIEQCRAVRKSLPDRDGALDSVLFLLGSGCYELGRMTRRADSLREAITLLGEVAETRWSIAQAPARYHQAGALLELGRLSSCPATLEAAGHCFRHAVTALGKFRLEDAAMLAGAFAGAAAFEAAKMRRSRRSYLRSAAYLQASIGPLVERKDAGNLDEVAEFCRSALEDIAKKTRLRYAVLLSHGVARAFGLNDPVKDLLESWAGDKVTTRQEWAAHRADAAFLEAVYVGEVFAGCDVGQDVESSVHEVVTESWGLDRQLTLVPEALPKFDKAPRSVPSKKDDTEEEKDEQISREAGAETEIKVGDDFAGAVGALKSELVPSVSDEQIERLGSVIRAAQQSTPADKISFVRDVRRMLEAAGLKLEIEGVGGAVQIGMKNGSIAFTVTGLGARSFRSTEVQIGRADELDFAPRGPRRSQAAAPENA